MVTTAAIWTAEKPYGVESCQSMISNQSQENTHTADGTAQREAANGEDFTDFDNEKAQQEKLHLSAIVQLALLQ